MRYKSIKGYSGWAQLGILFGLIGAGMLLAGLIQLYFGNQALGPNNLPMEKKAEAMVQALMKPENASYAQLSQILGTLFVFFVPAAAYIWICHRKFIWAGFNRYFSVLQIILGFFIILVASALAAPFATLSKTILSHFPYWNTLAAKADQTYNEAISAMSNLNTWPQFLLAIFIIAFLPALFEELLFRGAIQNLLTHWWKKPFLAIVVTSIIFSLVHASYYLFISRFLLGVALGMLFYLSKNIWVNTFAHFMNNLLALIQLFYLNKNHTKTPIDVSSMDAKLPLWSLGFSFALLVGLLILLNKVSINNRKKIEANSVYSH